MACILQAAPWMPPTTGPIAVGEPLYRLYTIILNRRLVGWSEEHQLCSPVQACFRPGQSPIHHLFALRHFQLSSHSALCMPALWTSKRPMTLSCVIFAKVCGTGWSPLGWNPGPGGQEPSSESNCHKRGQDAAKAHY